MTNFFSLKESTSHSFKILNPCPWWTKRNKYTYLIKLGIQELGGLGVTVPGPGMETYPFDPTFGGGAAILSEEKHQDI